MSEHLRPQLESPDFESILELRARTLALAELGTTPTPDAQQIDLVAANGTRLKVLKDTGWDSFSDWETSVDVFERITDDDGVTREVTTSFTLLKNGSLDKTISNDVIGDDRPEETPPATSSSREVIVETLGNVMLSLCGREGAMEMLANKINSDILAERMGFNDVSGAELESVLELLRSVSI